MSITHSVLQHPIVEKALESSKELLRIAQTIPPQTWLLIIAVALFLLIVAFYTFIFAVAPSPRPPLLIEEQFVTASADGTRTSPEKLPCWHYKYLEDKATGGGREAEIEPAEVFISLVVPAYNEEERITPMLQEALDFLESEYATAKSSNEGQSTLKVRGATGKVANGSAHGSAPVGWEILVVSDGSTDRTGEIVLDFAKRHQEGSIRLVKLARNRGKGGAVTHGMRHVRGEYIIFADADGASKFEDLRKLVSACQRTEDARGRAVAVGSRAHLVGSEAVVQRSRLRNFLMHSFHLLLWFLTPPATSRIKDTQCGFKLFSRQSLPDIIPHMHSEGWIFDVEMLMLAESANIPMVEVPIGWKEVKGSKLNVLKDSLGMAWGLAILRVAWAIGVYSL